MPPKKLGAYSILQTIGKGTMSKIRLGEVIETKELVIIKSLDIQRLEAAGLLSDVKKEIAVVTMLSNINVISIKEVMATPTRIFIVEDYMDGGTLAELLAGQEHGRLEELSCRHYFEQIVCGVEYIHGLGITHENLKLENILWNTSGQVRISDFSKAHLDLDQEVPIENSEEVHPDTMNGDEHDNTILKRGILPAYIPPEVIDDNCRDRKKLDLWSLGIILYTMSIGFLPFSNSKDGNIVELFKNIRLAKYRPCPSHVSEPLKILISKILVSNPILRSNLEDIKVSDWMDEDGSFHNLTGHRDSFTLGSPVLRRFERRSTNTNESNKTCDLNGFSIFCNPFTAFNSPTRLDLVPSDSSPALDDVSDII